MSTNNEKNEPFQEGLENIDENSNIFKERKNSKNRIVNIIIIVLILLIIGIAIILFFALFSKSDNNKENKIIAKYKTTTINQNIKLFDDKEIKYLDYIDSIKINNQTIKKTSNYTFNKEGEY